MKKLSGWIAGGSIVALAMTGIAFANTGVDKTSTGGMTAGPAGTTGTAGTLGTTGPMTMGTAGTVGTSGATGNFGGGPTATTKSLDDQTKMTLAFLHEKNQQEIKLGNLAKTKASTQEVKDFADHMVKEHTDADKQITDLGKQYSFDFTMPKDVMLDAVKSADTTCYADLSGKTGNAFETAYVAPQVADHQLVLAVIQKDEAVAPKDVKTALGKLETAIQSHLDMSKKIAGKLEFSKTGAIGGGPIGGGKSVEPPPPPASPPPASPPPKKPIPNDLKDKADF